MDKLHCVRLTERKNVRTFEPIMTNAGLKAEEGHTARIRMNKRQLVHVMVVCFIMNPNRWFGKPVLVFMNDFSK